MDVLWRWLHLVAAGFWLGGLIMLAMVTITAVRAVDRETFRRLIQRVGRAFLVGSMIAWVVLGISGVAMATLRLRGFGQLTTTPFGRTLLLKTGLFAAAIVLTIVHTIAGRRSSAVAIRLSRTLSPVIFLLTLGIFYLAVRLVEG